MDAKKKVTKAALRKLSMMGIMSEIVELTSDAKMFVTEESKPYCKELMERLSLPTMIHASLLSVFINFCDDSNIRISAIARHYDVRNIKVLAEKNIIDWLVSMHFIKRNHNSQRESRYSVSQRTLQSLGEGKRPEIKNIENLSAYDFIDEVDNLREEFCDDNICDEEFYDSLNNLIDKNGQLLLVQKWKEYCNNRETLLLYIVMSLRYINHNDDHIIDSDLDDYFSHRDLRRIKEHFGDGTHTLMKKGLVENCIEDGQADPDAWKLTDKSKYEVYSELNLKTPSISRNNLKLFTDIEEKHLFYNENVTKQVERLEGLMDNKRMTRVLKRMEDSGMRKGFTCLFYGGPGTGKTETVMQLARKTGRDIMLVDVPSIRSKWVGETEKNVKQLFERYKTSVKQAEKANMAAPILVFNEADAILNKRLEGGTSSVDKMENAMQNIILQEMENLEGIMIATTNLTGSLDAAFERRFLYKIEFEKPTPKERRHIWKSMLKDLTDEQSLELAEKFDFSGGQIENIARKRIINDILDEKDSLDMQAVIDSCKTELLNAKNERKKIGF